MINAETNALEDDKVDIEQWNASYEDADTKLALWKTAKRLNKHLYCNFNPTSSLSNVVHAYGRSFALEH